MRVAGDAVSHFRVSDIAKIVRRIIGVPDYDAYVAHQQACHPDDEPTTREEFAKDALTRRYERPGSRCC